MGFHIKIDFDVGDKVTAFVDGVPIEFKVKRIVVERLYFSKHSYKKKIRDTRINVLLVGKDNAMFWREISEITINKESIDDG